METRSKILISCALQMQSDAAPPQFFKPCPAPVAIKDAISQELDSLEYSKESSHRLLTVAGPHPLYQSQRKMGSSESVGTIM